MGRKKGGESDGQTEEKQKRKQVNIDPELRQKAKVIADLEDVTLPDYIDSLIRPTIEGEFARRVGVKPKKA